MPRSRAAREGLERADEASPQVPWELLQPRLEKAWKPGQHIAIFGPNGYGKTTVAVELGEMPPVPTVLLVTKRRDRLISELPRRGWILTRTLEQTRHALERRPGERYFGRRVEGPPPRIVFWPAATGGLRQRRTKLRTIVEKLLDWAYEHGELVLIVNEAHFVVRNLRQGEQIEMLLHEARAGGVSLVLESQRPAWLPHSAYSAPTYLVMFATNDRDDLKRLSEIGGAIDPQPLRDELQLLPMYEFLLVSPRSAPAWSLRSRIPHDRKDRHA